MMDKMFTSIDARVLGKESFFHVMQITGGGTTPFLNAITYAKEFNGNPSMGHMWGYRESPKKGSRNNAHKEGGCAVPPTSYPAVALKNQLQIFKKVTALTKSQISAAKNQKNCNLSETFEEQQTLNRNVLRLDMEDAFLSADQPVASTDDESIRRMGGVKAYIPANAIIDMAGAPLDTLDMADQGLRLMFDNGIINEDIIIMGGGDAFQDMNKAFIKNEVYNKEDKAHLKRYIKEITNAYAHNVGVIVNNNLENNEILIFAPRLCNPVPLRTENGVDVTTAGCDSVAKQDLVETTLQVLDPYACIWFKNVGRAK